MSCKQYMTQSEWCLNMPTCRLIAKKRDCFIKGCLPSRLLILTLVLQFLCWGGSTVVGSVFCLVIWIQDININLVCDQLNYWVGQKVHAGFSGTCERNTQMNFLANPVYFLLPILLSPSAVEWYHENTQILKPVTVWTQIPVLSFIPCVGDLRDVA